MAETFRFELDREGVRELLRSGEVLEMLEREAESRVASLGAGYTTDSYIGQNRCNVRIMAESEEAIRENLESNTLLQVIG